MHDEREAGVGEAVSRLGNDAGEVRDEASEGLELALGEGEVERLRELAALEHGIDEHAAIGLLLERALGLVELVADVADDLAQNVFEGDAARASAGVDEGRDVSDAASEAVDELNATGPASADVGDNGQLGQVPVEGDDVGPGDIDVGDEIHPGQAPVEGDTLSASDVVSGCEAGEHSDAGDEGQLGKVPFEDDTAVPGRTDVSDEVQLGQARVEGDAPSAGPSDPASDGIEVSAFKTGEYADPTSAQPADAADELNAAGPGDTAAGDDVQLGHAQVEGDTPTPQREHLGTLGPRGPPRSRS